MYARMFRDSTAMGGAETGTSVKLPCSSSSNVE